MDRATARTSGRGARRQTVFAACSSCPGAAIPRAGALLSVRRGTGDGGTGDGLWRYHDGKASEIWKGSDGALVEPPAISFDGQRVVFTLRRDGRRRLMLMSAEGADAKTLAASIEARNAADWSPDARWIVTGGRDDEQGEGLFKVPVDGGAPVKLAPGPAANPVWSPNGPLIVYAGPQVSGTSQLLAVRPDGSPVALPHLRVGPVRQQAHRFLPDGKGLVYTSSAPPAPDPRRGRAASGSSISQRRRPIRSHALPMKTAGRLTSRLTESTSSSTACVRPRTLS